MNSYNTNLTAEFHVLSILHRLGLDANLTLGNKKSVDIAIVRDAGEACTIDLKGLAGKTGWPVDNIRVKRGHFLVFVCFLGKIDDPKTVPELYVVPPEELERLTCKAPAGRRLIQLSRMRRDGANFPDSWNLLSKS